jgi:hypothetical protein
LQRRFVNGIIILITGQLQHNKQVTERTKTKIKGGIKMLESGFNKIISESKVRAEELTGKEFKTVINFDNRKGDQKNNFYFLINDELNFEIAISWGTRNGFVTHDMLDIRIQKPNWKIIEVDARSVYAEKNAIEKIVDEIKEII